MLPVVGLQATKDRHEVFASLALLQNEQFTALDSS